MQKIPFNDLVKRFTNVPVAELKWLTPVDKLQSLIVNQVQEPENLKDTFYDPNEIFIQGKHQKLDKKQKQQKQHKQSKGNKEVILGKKTQEKIEPKQVKEQAQSTDEKKKVYKAGSFALFYELNENKLDKDAQVWYYKEDKDIIGPVSSYNMDKMAYYKNITDETKVAYKSVDKFVKFSKIKKVVEANRKQVEENEETQ